MSADLVCQFCGEADCLDKCDWPTMDFVPMRVRDLQVGDQVRRFNESAPRPSIATVVEIQDFYTSHAVTFNRWDKRRIVLQIEGRNRLRGSVAPRMKVFTDSIYAAIRIKRPAKCEKVCCANHRADRGPGAVHCADHWRAWEQLA